MSDPIFIWPVTTDSSGDAEFGMHDVKFGENYGQSTPNAIDNERLKWSATCNGYSNYVIDTVLAFIRERAGRSFLWKPPGCPQRWYKCTGYNIRNESGNYYVVTFNFEQAYKPV